ncbi:bZIP transcription factor 12-like [Papaver somniferum]|uniref:bZIP transcription factor 12-like n=1 Tax=Papaver somniferum TaxID=3469 RepID=UPI000E704F9A|nr:bZIP transcription factor 12-like [Papaver somniferum]
MASSKVMATTNSTNSDLAHQTTSTNTYSLQGGGGQSKNFGSMNMDELLRNFCNDNHNSTTTLGGGGGGGDGETNLSRQESFPKTAAEVWREITGGGDDDDVDRKEEKMIFNEMTLEEYLAKTGALGEEDVRIPTVVGPVTGFVVDSPYPQGQIELGGSILGYGNGATMEGGGRVVGRGKRRAVVQEPIDKVAQQRQRRMIKNRESAARSRERKQAYTVELETQVSQLVAENERLTKEQKERNRERYMQLMETRIPVEEKQRPQPVFVLSKWNSSNTPMGNLYPVEEKPRPQLVFEPSKRDLFNAPTPHCLFRGRKKDLRRTNSVEW